MSVPRQHEWSTCVCGSSCQVCCGFARCKVCGQSTDEEPDTPCRGSRHTPGPWTVCPETTYIQAPCTSFVAEMRGVGPGFPIEANAKLIAAAPDLLEACKHVIQDLSDYGFVNASHISCQMAIAKALDQEVMDS